MDLAFKSKREKLLVQLRKQQRARLKDDAPCQSLPQHQAELDAKFREYVLLKLNQDPRCDMLVPDIAQRILSTKPSPKAVDFLLQHKHVLSDEQLLAYLDAHQFEDTVKPTVTALLLYLLHGEYFARDYRIVRAFSNNLKGAGEMVEKMLVTLAIVTINQFAEQSVQMLEESLNLLVLLTEEERNAKSINEEGTDLLIRLAEASGTGVSENWLVLLANLSFYSDLLGERILTIRDEHWLLRLIQECSRHRSLAELCAMLVSNCLCMRDRAFRNRLVEYQPLKEVIYCSLSRDHEFAPFARLLSPLITHSRKAELVSSAPAFVEAIMLNYMEGEPHSQFLGEGLRALAGRGQFFSEGEERALQEVLQRHGALGLLDRLLLQS